MDHRHLEPVHEELRAGRVLERPGGSEVVGVDVGDDQPAELGPGSSHLPDRVEDGRHRGLGLDAGVEEVDLRTGGEEEAVDDLLLPGDREADLVDAGRDQSELGLSGTHR